MNTTHQIRCRCGAFSGHIETGKPCNRAVCYCTDCRAFAHYLGRGQDTLDAHGGTEIVQIAQPQIVIRQGKEHLAAIRLSDKGLIRWYAACCKTPIGNTMANPKISFFGSIHTILDRANIEADFGAITAYFNTATATGEPKPKERGLPGVILRLLRIIVPMRIGGGYRQSPLFDDAGQPIVRPTVLSPEETAKLKQIV